MFKNKLLTAFVSTVAIGLSGYAMNASATDIVGGADASVDIIAPMTLVQTTAMYFGNVSPDTAVSTTVVLDNANGVTSPPAGGGERAGMSGVPLSGLFTVGGVNGASYAITLPAAPVALGAMSLGTFVGLSASTSSATGGTLGPGDTFTVGATLTIPGGQAAGNYTTTYPVTVNYN